MIKIDDASVIRVNGMGEPDINGSYAALTLTEYGNEGEAPQSLTFKLSEGLLTQIMDDIAALCIIQGFNKP